MLPMRKLEDIVTVSCDVQNFELPLHRGHDHTVSEAGEIHDNEKPRLNFEYTPLSHLPDGTIRLLELFPGHRHAKIRCSVSTIQLTSKPEFAALSYVWGTKPASEEIELNNKQFWIRKSLWQCLLDLRELNKSRAIWIDAICVNQEDIAERNQQVKLMSHIFGIAKPVFAWLGEDVGDACATLLEDIRQAEHFCRPLSMNGNVNVATGDKRKRFTTLHRFKPVTTTEVETFLRLCRAVTALCKRDYWHRVWIVPELFVAQQLVLCCGGQRIPWMDLSNIYGCLSSSLENFPNLDPYDNSAIAETVKKCHNTMQNAGLAGFVRQRRRYRMGGEGYKLAPLTLKDLIATHRDKGCSDPRDRVYALLGLRKYDYGQHSRGTPQIQADYGRTTADLFFDVMASRDATFPRLAQNLQFALHLKTDELEKHSMLRNNDRVPSLMIFQAKVREVLFYKISDASTPGHPHHSQFVLIEVEFNENTVLLFWRPRESREDLLMALAVGRIAVMVGDLIFRIQHSSLLVIYRQRRNALMPISRLQTFMAFPDIVKKPLHLTMARPIPAEAIPSSLMDDEIWNGMVEVSFGPDVLLEVMQHELDTDDDYETDDGALDEEE